MSIRAMTTDESKKFIVTAKHLEIEPCPMSAPWQCYLFGNKPGGGGMVYRPYIGNIPNWFIRWMMNVCLGCMWVKDKKE